MDASALLTIVSVGSPIVAGIAAYFAAQKGVAVALARHDERLKYLKESQDSHHSEDSAKFKEVYDRLLELERVGTRYRP